MTDAEKIVNKYLNLIRNSAKRRYGFAYVAWLKNGASGNEPSEKGVSAMAAQAVRLEIDRLTNGNPFAVRA